MHDPLRRAVLAVALLAAGLAAQAEQRQQILIVGSSALHPFASAVAEHFGKGGRFRTPTVEATGTGAGFKLFCRGAGAETPDINGASRPITDGERAICARNGVTEIGALRIGYEGIVVAGAAGSPALDVTLEQLWRAAARTVPLRGRWLRNPYQKWSDIDRRLPGSSIRLLGPAPHQRMRDAFLELVMDPGCRNARGFASLAETEQKKFCLTVREDGAWTDVQVGASRVVDRIRSDPTALGLFTFGDFDRNRDRLQAVAIGGVAASTETIASGRYAASRPLFIYVKSAHVATVPGLAQLAQAFVSPSAAGPDGYLVAKGLTPLAPRDLKAQQAVATALLEVRPPVGSAAPMP